VAEAPGSAADRGAGWAHALFGVALPIGALVFELHTRASDSIYFDPIPTWWHVALIGSVAAANAHAVWVLHGEWQHHAVAALRATAFALAIALFYTALYLPILPPSAIAVVFLGMGVLPYTPLFAAIATWGNRRRLASHFPAAVAPARARWALAAGFAVLALLETSGWIAQAGFTLASGGPVFPAPDGTGDRAGVALLRAVGTDTAMRRVVHHGRARANLTGHLLFARGFWGLDGLHDSTGDLERARTYYRATGFPTSEPPRSARLGPAGDVVRG